MIKIDCNQLWQTFEIDLASKLQNLPSHRDISENLLEYRNIISHELPETTEIKIYQQMISNLVSGRDVDITRARNIVLKTELEKERLDLTRKQSEYETVRVQINDWVKSYLSENKLQRLWKEHKTWLPRRYLIYPNPNVSFQIIAIDTLSRYQILSSDLQIL